MRLAGINVAAKSAVQVYGERYAERLY